MAVAARVLVFFSSATAVLGQDAVPVKAGDRAPEIDRTKIAQSPEPAKYQPSLTRQYNFAIRASDRAECAGDRPIEQAHRKVPRSASENWSVVQAFLREHPMDGWLPIDEKDNIARAYGCEMGCDAIGRSGGIAGFTSSPSTAIVWAFWTGEGDGYRSRHRG
jgi:hypothetical protein